MIGRSFLFVPGDRPERFDKATNSGAHRIVLDLEDAVAPDRKEFARDAAAGWVRSHPRAIVRINGADTPWYAEDIRALAPIEDMAAVMVPKAEADSLIDVSMRLPNRKLVALVETVRGLLAIREATALKMVRRFAFGSVDFCADSGILDADDSMTAIRVQIVLESKLAGLPPPLDGISVELANQGILREHAARSRSLGFGGKLCIHPRQVEVVNAAFVPNRLELEWARRVLTAFGSSAASAIAVDGKIVDLAVVARARQLLDEAGDRPA